MSNQHSQQKILLNNFLFGRYELCGDIAGPVLRVAPLGGKYGQFVGRGDYEEQQQHRQQDYEDPYGRLAFSHRGHQPSKHKQSAVQSHQGKLTSAF